MYIKLILTIVILACFCQISAAEELIQAPAAIEISSTVSDGKHTIPEIMAIARENNIKVVIVTDYDIMRWQYGLWPLRNIIKKTEETNSVFNYGIKRYLQELDQAQRKNPDLVIIPAVNCAPFYYWSGSVLKNNLKIHNWHKHILVMGLEKVSDYKNLPSVANRYSLRLPYRLKNVFYLLLPILILWAGIFCLKKRKFNYKDLYGHPLGPYSRGWQGIGVFLLIFGILFLLNNYPYRDFKFDQYQGELGIAPYQNLIDYVNEHGGLTFWAHPEAKYIQKRGNVGIETWEHTGELLEADGYSGFAIFYEGWHKVGCIGGIWDKALKQYCQGKRKRPIWAIGALSFDQIGELSSYMNHLRTVFLLPQLNRTEVLKALKEGKMYVVRGKQNIRLDNFTVDLQSEPIIKIAGSFLNRQAQGKIKLIRDGLVIKTFEAKNDFSIEYQDMDYQVNAKSFYRLQIRYHNTVLISNPIFVNFLTNFD